MKYKFVSKEQARNDWENGRVQIEHDKGSNIKLIDLCMMFGDKSMPSCNFDYYIIRFSKDWFGSYDHFPGIPSVPTDELWEMIFGEYQQEEIPDLKPMAEHYQPLFNYLSGEHGVTMLISEMDELIGLCDKVKSNIDNQPQEEIIGHELNGKVTAGVMRIFLGLSEGEYFPLKFGDKRSEEIIQRAKDLGILSTCFNPIYKQKEVKVKFANGIARVSKLRVELPYPIISITDIQKILDAHKTL